MAKGAEIITMFYVFQIRNNLMKGIFCNPLTPNDIYVSYRTGNLQTFHFIYLVNKYTY
jgi:hypothetical protein